MATINKKRAPRVLSWGIGLFLVIQVIAGLLLDYLWPMVRFPEARAVYDRLAAQSVPPSVVFLGSSRTEGGIVPNVISPLLERTCHLDKPCGIFNAALPAGDPIVYGTMFDGLERNGVQPEYLIIEVNPETVNNRNDWLGIHTYRQLNWGDVLTHTIPTIRSGHGMRFLSSRLFPIFLHRRKILDQLEDWWEGTKVERSWAWKHLDASSQRAASGTVDWDLLLQPPHSEVSEELQAKIKIGTDMQPRRWLKTYRPKGLNRDALERLLARCRDQQIKTILLSAPVTQSHRETYRPEVETQFRDCIAGLQQKYHLVWVDARDWIPDGLFVDNHHLDIPGSVYYSRLITYRLLVPLFSTPFDQLVNQHGRVMAGLAEKGR